MSLCCPVCYTETWGVGDSGLQDGLEGCLSKSSPFCCHKEKLRPREAQARGWVHEPGGAPREALSGLGMQASEALSPLPASLGARAQIPPG